MRRYFGQHAFGNATLADLLAALEETSGRDLSTWSKQWLETAGVNTLRPEIQVGDDGAITEFAVLQEAPAAHPVLRPHRIAVGLYDRTEAGLIRRRRVEADVSGDRSVLTDLAGEDRPDLVLINDDDLTYAKIRLDEHSLRTLISAIGEFQDSLPAALCWSAAWDMCRDAEMAARDYVRLVMSGLDSVGDISVAQTLLRQAGAAARRYTDPAWRDTGLRLIAATSRELLQRAEPGSDRQLAYLQALTGVAAEPGDLAWLRGLLDGSTTLDGLAVDTELRWRLLHRLVSRGAAGPTETAAELARDATDAGERRAATCRAAIPDATAKQAAWDAITSGALPNAMFRATLAGFVDPDQPELLQPYARRYFDVIGNIWREWSSDMAQWFVNNAYPLFLVSPETVRMTDEYIAEANPPAPLHRLLTECRDSVQRALRCQERDRQEG